MGGGWTGFEWGLGMVSNGAGAWFRMARGPGFEWGAGLDSNGVRGWFRMETAGGRF